MLKIQIKMERFTWHQQLFHPLPNDKILDWSKFKALADDKINVTYK